MNSLWRGHNVSPTSKHRLELPPTSPQPQPNGAYPGLNRPGVDPTLGLICHPVAIASEAQSSPLSITCRSRQNSLVTSSATLVLQRSSGQISNRLQKTERQRSLENRDCMQPRVPEILYLVQVPSQDCTNYTYRSKGAAATTGWEVDISHSLMRAFAACGFSRST
jgi:hypothetical protein